MSRQRWPTRCRPPSSDTLSRLSGAWTILVYSAGLKSTLTNASAPSITAWDGHPAIGLGLVTGQMET